MCFNGTGIWGGETISRHKGFTCSGLFLAYSNCLIKIYSLISYFIEFYNRCNNLSVIVFIRKYIIGE